MNTVPGSHEARQYQGPWVTNKSHASMKLCLKSIECQSWTFLPYHFHLCIELLMIIYFFSLSSGFYTSCFLKHICWPIWCMVLVWCVSILVACFCYPSHCIFSYIFSNDHNFYILTYSFCRCLRFSKRVMHWTCAI